MLSRLLIDMSKNKPELLKKQKLKKTKIVGKLINLRLVIMNDAQFILNLRIDKDIIKFISSTSTSLIDQKKWIRNYLTREKKKKEYYFIIETKDSKPCGTVRIYKINDKKKECTWGSFILNSIRPDGSSYEVISSTLNYAFNTLNMKKVFLDVKKENKKAIYIYEKSGFKRFSEDLENCYYEMRKK
ncbi:MAG: GNAT family N-acetyltransferase [Cetobacterium sp.]